MVLLVSLQVDDGKLVGDVTFKNTKAPTHQTAATAVKTSLK